jgi:hypothetical protein
MHNLRGIKHEILFNSLSALNAGMFTDSVTTKRNLFLKKKDFGIQLEYGGTAGDVTIEKSCYDPGNLKMSLLELTGVCPCDDCNTEYSILLRSRHKNPGQFNDNEHILVRPYSTMLDRVECTAGYLNTDLVLAMEDDLIYQINADIARTGEIGGPAKAFRVYRVTTANGGDEILDITINGTTTSINLAETKLAGTTVAGADDGNANVINATAAVNDYIRCIPISATEFLLIGQANGEEFYAADGGGVSTLGFTNRYLGIVAKDPMIQVDVEYDSKWADLVKGWLFVHTAPTAITADAIVIVENATQTSVGETTVDATHMANLAGALTYGYASFNDTADVFYVAGIDDLGVEKLDVKLTSIATSTYVTSMTPFGRFPALTNDEVFRVFANKQHMGNLSSEMRLDQPIADTDYCKFAITAKLYNVVAQHGPDAYTTKEVRVDVYVPKSIIHTDHWTNGSWMDETEAAPDRHFQELLEAWSGLTLPL